MEQDKLAELNQHLSAARHTGRKLQVTETPRGFKACFWKPDGDGVKTWTATDEDLLRAIAKAGEEYAVDMMVHDFFGGKPENSTKYERDFLLMLILDEEQFGPGAFDRAVEKLQGKQER